MIWFKNYTLADIQPYVDLPTMVKWIGIEITEIGADFVKASMPVNDHTRQIHGIMHGGATCALVETVGSFASKMCIDPEKQNAVGSVINVNHLRPMRDGIVVATCRPVHVGRQKHVWDVEVHAQDSGKIVAKGELTCAVINEPPGKMF